MVGFLCVASPDPGTLLAEEFAQRWLEARINLGRATARVATGPNKSMKKITPGDELTALGEILLVEDSANDAELAQLAFRRARIANPLRVVSSAEEAWNYLLGLGAYLKRGATQPLLILLDLQLPRMSGVELLRQLKRDERTRDLSVVSLSGTTGAPAIVTCLKLGIDSHLIKPIDFKDLVHVTRKLKLRLSRTPPTTGRA